MIINGWENGPTIDTFTFPLWGGKAVVLTAHTTEVDHRRIEQITTGVLDSVERSASNWRDDSELSRLNDGNGEMASVGALLQDVLEVALNAAARTRGAVDPTVGTVTLSKDAAGAHVTRTGSWHDVVLDPEAGTVQLPADTKLDLGAIGKAYAADATARAIFTETGLPVLVNLGGDMRAYGGAPDRGWRVLVTDDHRREPDRAADTDEQVVLHAGAIATSSVTVRIRRRRDGSTVGHVRDPRTMRPVTGPWRTVSVCAADCVTANTASTAALVMGRGAEDFLRRTGLPARLVGSDSRVKHVGNWPTSPVLALAR